MTLKKKSIRRPLPTLSTAKDRRKKKNQSSKRNKDDETKRQTDKQNARKVKESAQTIYFYISLYVKNNP